MEDLLTQKQSSVNYTDFEKDDHIKRQFKTWLSIIVIISITGIVISFKIFINLIATASFLGLLFGFTNPVLGMFFMATLVATDPIIRTFILDGGLLRWNTLNYWLILYTLYNIKLLFNNLTNQVILAIIFTLLMTIQLGYSKDTINGIQSILGIFSFIGLYVYWLTLKNYDIKKLIYYICIAMLLSGFIAGLLFFINFGFDSFSFAKIHQLKYTEGNINPNAFATTLVSGIMLCAVAYKYTNSSKKRFNLVVLQSACLILILFTGSRGTLLVGIISFFFIVIKNINLVKLSLITGGAYLILLMISPYLVDSKNVAAEKINVLFNEDANTAKKTSGRSDLARVGLELFLVNPLGKGTGSYSAAYEEYTTFHSDILESSFNQVQKQSHSAFIKILTENGIFGIILFLSFLTSFYSKKVIDPHKMGFYFIVLAGVTFLSTEFANKPIWYVGGAIVFILYTQKKENDTLESTD